VRTRLRFFAYCFFLFLLPVQLISQTVSITVRDARRIALAGATVHMTPAENGQRKSTISSQNGVAVFEQVSQGLYTVNITYIGFKPLEKSVVIRGGQNNFDYQLEDDLVSLGEVTVTAARPLIRQEDDKMIIDPEPIASISTNTLEILENTPGLFVDQDGGIFLSSATPATIYINGREQKMSSQDVNNILRSLPPGSVQHIEVIRNPSARYAASSSGGIINIVLKKGVRIGRFGSINTGMNQGYYGNRFAGISMNNSGDRTTQYINFNLNNNNLREELNSVRLLEENDLQQAAVTKRQSNQGFLGYGIAFDPNDRIGLSYDGRINGSLPGSVSVNTNSINAADGTPQFKTLNSVNNDSRFLNIQQDFGFKYRLDTLGSEIDSKFNLSFVTNNSLQDYENLGLFPFEARLTSGDGNNNQRRYYIQFQSDLSQQLPWKIKLETGINTSFQNYRSNADFMILPGNKSQYEIDTLRTNAYNYQDNINAAYLQFSRPLPLKLLLKTGLRMEHTWMQGNQTIPANANFIVNRVDWFPYVYLSRPLFSLAGFELRSFLIYRRTVTRPGYQNLNPHITYIDEFLYEAGNPGLRPQFADNIEANISMNDWPIFAVGRNYTSDIFTGVIYTDSLMDRRIAVRTFDNLGKSRETYFRAMAGIPPGGRYFFALGTQYNYNEYDGQYENQPFVYSRGSWRFFTFHMLRLAPETRLTLNGFMMTNGQFNFYELKTFGQLNIGLNQTFLNKKLTVSLTARDVLRTMVNKFEVTQGGIRSYGDRYTDNQRVGVNIRYNFGIPQKRDRQQQNMFQFEDNGNGI
jgi:iron complex outermembrane recepter protein